MRVTHVMYMGTEPKTTLLRVQFNTAKLNWETTNLNNIKASITNKIDTDK